MNSGYFKNKTKLISMVASNAKKALKSSEKVCNNNNVENSFQAILYF